MTEQAPPPPPPPPPAGGDRVGDDPAPVTGGADDAESTSANGEPERGQPAAPSDAGGEGAADEGGPIEESGSASEAPGSNPADEPVALSDAVAQAPFFPPPPDALLDRRSIQAARRNEAKKGRRRWPRRVAYVLGALVILAGSLVGGLLAYARYQFDHIKKDHLPHLVKDIVPDKPFNLLLVGSDSRAFVTNATQEKAFGSASEEGGQRSDVTMVARIIPATKQVWILSLPRDLWVNIPGDVPGISGMNRINAAFNNGPDLLIQTIEQDFGIPINHYASVNFNGFQGMVDSLGGITMDFPMPVKDSYSGLHVTTTGCQVVDGATALELVRARHLYYEEDGYWHYDGLSDFSRIQRQDAFFRAVLERLNASITNPIAINGFISAAVGNLTIDDTLSESELFTLAEQLHGLSEANLHTETLPAYSFTTSGGAAVLGEAEPYAQNMISAFKALGEPTAKPTATPSTSPRQSLLAPADVHVEVLNGAGLAGIAGRTAASLEQLGFQIGNVTDASNFDFTASQIQYGPGGLEAAKTLQSAIEGATTLVPDPDLSGNIVILTVGSEFTGVNTPTNGTSTTTTTTQGSGTTGTTTGSGGATGATGSSTTTTTIPADIYTNTQQEPWNPYPCQL